MFYSPERSSYAPPDEDLGLLRLLLLAGTCPECMTTDVAHAIKLKTDRHQCAPLTGGEVSRNFFYAPSVYNGRASSVVPSPHPIRRPKGVKYDSDAELPVYGPSAKMDFELEMGYFVSEPIPMGETIKAENAPEHIFGFVLLNDWSSRDIQAFEMAPLGPFHSKGDLNSSNI